MDGEVENLLVMVFLFDVHRHAELHASESKNTALVEHYFHL